MFEIKCTEDRARRGVLHTVHGDIETPVFMNVGTCAAIKGGVATYELKEIGCQVELSNTYHLHIRPGDKLIHDMGGIRKFMNWDGPVLTDSGGFQVFSLAQLRKITEEGVRFASHIDGKRIFMGPEESMQIQSNLASTIAMAFDECIENPAPYDYVKASTERTYRWLVRCKAEMERLNSLPDTINPHQMLFGINQGSTYEDLRIAHMLKIAELDLDGYAIVHPDGLKALVDTLGGIYFNVPCEMDFGDVIIKSGNQTLDGSKTVRVLGYGLYVEAGQSREKTAVDFAGAVMSNITQITNYPNAADIYRSLAEYVETDYTEEMFLENRDFIFKYAQLPHDTRDPVMRTMQVGEKRVSVIDSQATLSKFSDYRRILTDDSEKQ